MGQGAFFILGAILFGHEQIKLIKGVIIMSTTLPKITDRMFNMDMRRMACPYCGERFWDDWTANGEDQFMIRCLICLKAFYIIIDKTTIITS